ncbi:AfsR/SARP family transcriptional regulator [Streptomyces sp. NPDC001393]
MRIRVLGPFSAEANRTSFMPTAAKPRQILAVLTLNAGQPVPVPTLIEELWSAEPPQSAPTTLQTYISQLRRKLDIALGRDTRRRGKDILVTCPDGYMLQTPLCAVDVYEHERLVTIGDRAFAAGNDDKAAAVYRAALTLWTGAALEDVPCGPVLQAEQRRLEDARLLVLERRIDTDLRLGRHTRLLSELAGLVVRHPLHEALHAQAMVALYRSGRPAAAVGVYRTLRQLLVDRLGVEPSPQLQHLHRAVLAADPALNITAGPRHTSTFDLFAA